MSLPDDPQDLSVPAGREYWIDLRKTEYSDNTIYTNRKGTDPFVVWCEKQEIETVGDLTPWLIKQYEGYAHGRDDWNGVTTRNKLQALKQFLEFLDKIEATGVEGHLAPVVDVPRPDEKELINHDRYHKEDALPQIRYLRNSPQHRGKRYHSITEVVWFTARREQAIVALDKPDYVSEPGPDDPATGPYLRFKHRPDQGTGLKNDEKSEEVVEISRELADVLDYFIERERIDKRDEYGRQPLFTTRQGRISRAVVRAATYRASQPCIRMRCPHGKKKETCEFRERDHLSKCPSSKSPHMLRTGSIQWQLDQGIPIEDVSDRVDCDPDTIRKHYDLPEDIEKMEDRRREYTEDLEDSIDGEGEGEETEDDDDDDDDDAAPVARER